MNIYEKISAIMSDVSNMKKTGFNSYHKYTYFKEEDISNYFRVAFAKHKLVMIVDIIESSKEGRITTVKAKTTIINSEKPEETISFHTHGQGADDQDKGIYKALAGVTKYALMKTFLVGSDDDPEKDTGSNSSNEYTREKVVQPEAYATSQEAIDAPGASFRKYIYKNTDGDFVPVQIDDKNPTCPMHHDLSLGDIRTNSYKKLYYFCEKCKESGIHDGYYNESRYQ